MTNIGHEDAHVELAVQLTPHGEYVFGKYARPFVHVLPAGQVSGRGRLRAIGQGRLKESKALATTLGLSSAGTKAAILDRIQRASARNTDQVDVDWVPLHTELLEDCLYENTIHPGDAENGPALTCQ